VREFNIALLGKWCCRRMLVGRGGLWFRVLAARYGMEGGRNGSSWWREIVKIRDGVGGLEGSWFEECVSKTVGDGVDTYFWIETWLGGIPLSVRFRRLFDLAENKSSMVKEMFLLGWGEGGDAWKWQRCLWAWEEELLGECRVLLHDIILQTHFSDKWQWQLDPVRGYSVRGVYRLLTTQADVTLTAAEDLI
ncbi:receptor-like kinase, partial [Trifolium medium]|nr:receptor-like kinase [Trifolium medium]